MKSANALPSECGVQRLKSRCRSIGHFGARVTEGPLKRNPRWIVKEKHRRENQAFEGKKRNRNGHEGATHLSIHLPHQICRASIPYLGQILNERVRGGKKRRTKEEEVERKVETSQKTYKRPRKLAQNVSLDTGPAAWQG